MGGLQRNDLDCNPRMSAECEDVESTFDFKTVTTGLLQPSIVERGTSVPNRKRYLIVFKHRYLNFRLAEAQALAEIAHGKT